MIGYDEEMQLTELLAPLRRLEPVPFAVPKRPPRRPLLRPVAVAAIVVAALALTGAAIADGLGAFKGISAAQHPQTGTDVLDPRTVARLQQNCPVTTFWTPQCHLVLDTARLVGQLPSGGNLYVVADTRGDLCEVEPTGMECGVGLTPARPFTATSIGRLMFGVTLDGVTAISFENGGKEVTVPVKDNVWVYEGAALPEAITAHFKDGRAVTLHS